jgi:hypothetical protein
MPMPIYAFVCELAFNSDVHTQHCGFQGLPIRVEPRKPQRLALVPVDIGDIGVEI